MIYKKENKVFYSDTDWGYPNNTYPKNLKISDLFEEEDIIFASTQKELDDELKSNEYIFNNKDVVFDDEFLSLYLEANNISISKNVDDINVFVAPDYCFHHEPCVVIKTKFIETPDIERIIFFNSFGMFNPLGNISNEKILKIFSNTFKTCVNSEIIYRGYLFYFVSRFQYINTASLLRKSIPIIKESVFDIKMKSNLEILEKNKIEEMINSRITDDNKRILDYIIRSYNLYKTPITTKVLLSFIHLNAYSMDYSMRIYIDFLSKIFNLPNCQYAYSENIFHYARFNLAYNCLLDNYQEYDECDFELAKFTIKKIVSNMLDHDLNRLKSIFPNNSFNFKYDVKIIEK